MKKTCIVGSSNGEFGVLMDDVFMPRLTEFIRCEDRGQAAALMLADRRYPDLVRISRHRCGRLQDSPQIVAYEVHRQRRAPEVWVVTSNRMLNAEGAQEQHAAIQRDSARDGWTFVAWNGSELMQSIELKNVLLVRPFALVELSHSQFMAVLNAFGSRSEVPLGELAGAAYTRGAKVGHIFALLYRGLLEIDWATVPMSPACPVRITDAGQSPSPPSSRRHYSEVE